MSELKVGRRQRSVIIPGGKAQNGWKVFGLELRKMLELDQYALGCSGQAKFVSQPQRRMSGFHPSRCFVETLKGQVQSGDVIQSQHITTKDKDKNMSYDAYSCELRPRIHLRLATIGAPWSPSCDAMELRHSDFTFC